MASPKSTMSHLSQDEEMYVTKRNGVRQIVSFDKILTRIKKIGAEANIKLNYTSLVMKVIDQLYDGISATKIDELLAEQCASMASIHTDYNTLAGRITISNFHKNTSSSFVDTMTRLYNYIDKHETNSPLISEELFVAVNKYPEEFEKMIDYERDYLIEYFGFKTLERSYLMKINKITVERPQHMWLRVSIGIHGENLDKIKETYDLMSQKYFTHATPTLFNAGTPRPQLSSCYLLSMEDDSIDGIFNTLKDCALISKWAGGIGLHIHNVRASGSHIRGTNGSSNGIVPMLRVFNNTAKYVDQCVHSETVIYTKNGLMPISQCVPGVTEIFNSKGDSEVIQNVLEHHYDGNIIEIETERTVNPLLITEEHPIYCVANPNGESNQVILNDLNAGLKKCEWIDAKDVRVNDYIVYTIPTYEKDFPILTEEVCYLYGIIFEGIYAYNTMLNKGDFIEKSNVFYIKSTNGKIKKLAQYFEKNCIKHIVKYLTDDEDDDDENYIHWENSVNIPFIKNDFYNSYGRMKVSRRWLFLPKTKIRCILSGMTHFFSDDFYFLNIRLGKISENSICYLNHMLVPVKTVSQPRQHVGLLYDLQMEKQHDYLLQNGLVHNGGGKRNGSFAIYLEPWHADIEIFLQMRKNHGDEELKARDLFYALWIPDLFMERVKSEGTWTLFCPDECPGLSDVYGDKFVELYTQYEMSGKGRKTMKARDLWFQVLDAQMETGTPYLLYKDACNKKSNQQNVGTIKSSNLCSEIVEYSDDKETAVCNLASIALPAYVEYVDDEPVFNYEKLHEVTKVITYNLNRIIDVNYYPTPKTELSNFRHRPIGIGIQGLADTFMMMNMAFSSDAAKDLNKKIFETIYHGAVERSCEMAKLDGPYSTFAGSPASQGKLQFDLWNVDPTNERYDWSGLKDDVVKHGLRNSLLLAPMPTASTSQILGYNECIEPITSNIYTRRTIAGEFILANKYLMKDLMSIDMWNEKVKNNIIANNGSIQHIDLIPLEIREKYRTVWELPMRNLIDMAADRGAYICQSQSLNLWLEDPNYKMLTSMHFYSWSKGLKTGIYYLRRRGRHQAQQFTIEPEKKSLEGSMYEDNEEICEMCSS
jgi:ribonucleoside-diphosphate reductase alpha subunit